MKNIELVGNFDFIEKIRIEKEREVKEIFSGARRQILEVKIRQGGILPKHKAREPITVICLSGKGILRAGENLEAEQALQAGTLITLVPEIEHEAAASEETGLHLSDNHFFAGFQKTHHFNFTEQYRRQKISRFAFGKYFLIFVVIPCSSGNLQDLPQFIADNF